MANETVTAEGWTPFMARKPKVGQRIIVMNSLGQEFYAIYFEDNGIDVHMQTGDDYREGWYKFTDLSFPVWRPLADNA
jgi:hydrogenase maturation factor